MSVASRFRISEAIKGDSSGKFGRIFKGYSKSDDRPVIIKTLVKEHTEITSVERLRNEAQFSFAVPGLPEVLEYYESDSECILVRNYAEGETLETYWKKLKRRQRIPFVLHFLAEMQRLFEVLDEKKVVHCDIRPGNILVDRSTQHAVHLLDFGLAINTAIPEDRKLIFPLGYAAPELLLNQLDLVCRQTDIFSLGILIWRLYTGHLPLTHPNPSIFTNLQLTHPLPDHSELKNGVLPVLQKMTVKHQFRLPPNKMESEEVHKRLQEAISERYRDLHEVISDLEKLPRPFYQKRSFL